MANSLSVYRGCFFIAKWVSIRLKALNECNGETFAELLGSVQA
jgi:hypothetical protein